MSKKSYEIKKKRHLIKLSFTNKGCREILHQSKSPERMHRNVQQSWQMGACF
jgi:hypothetical protein